MSGDDEEKNPEKVNIFKFLWALVSFRPYHFVWNIVGSIIFFLLPLLTAFAIREILNNLQGVGSLNWDIWLLVWLIPLSYAIRMVVDIINTIVEFMFTMSLQILMRSNIFSGVFDQPGSEALQGRTAGESISRFRGDTMEVSWFINFIPILVSFAVFFVLAFTVMLNINSRVTVIVFIPFVLVVAIVTFARDKLSEYRKATRSAAGAVTGAVGDIFTNIQAIKINNGEDNLQRYFDDLSETRRRAAVKDNTFATIIRQVGGFITVSSIGVILLLIGQDMQRGNFTVGDLSLFIFLLDWISGFVRTLGEFISWQARAGVSYHRMYVLMKGVREKKYEDLAEHHDIYLENQFVEPDYLSKLETDSLNLLKVENLRLRYPDTGLGITNISFEIKPGEFVVVTGRVGSGKSTLLKALLGLKKLDAGEIYWNGERIEHPEDYFIPPRVVYTSQVPTLFSETVRENLLLGLPDNEQRIAEALMYGVVEEDVETFEDGLETTIGPKGIKLSGGQKYRIAAARMFMRSSELLVIDDLSSALDVTTEKRLWERIFENKLGTYIAVSHRPFVLKRADRIILMKDGEIEGIGDLNELLSTSEEMRHLWDEISLSKKDPPLTAD